MWSSSSWKDELLSRLDRDSYFRFDWRKSISDSIQKVLEADHRNHHLLIQKQAHMQILGKPIIQVPHWLLFFHHLRLYYINIHLNIGVSFICVSSDCLELKHIKILTLRVTKNTHFLIFFSWIKILGEAGVNFYALWVIDCDVGNVSQLSTLYGSEHKKVI